MLMVVTQCLNRHMSIDKLHSRGTIIGMDAVEDIMSSQKTKSRSEGKLDIYFNASSHRSSTWVIVFVSVRTKWPAKSRNGLTGWSTHSSKV